MNLQATLLFKFLKKLNISKAYLDFNMYEEDIDYIDKKLSTSKGQIPLPETLFNYLEKIIDDNTEKISTGYEDDTTGYVHGYLSIDVDNEKFIINSKAQYYGSEYNETYYDFYDRPEWKETFKELFEQNGWKGLIVKYNGGGDSGYIEETTEMDSGDNVTLPDEVEEIIYHLLNSFYSGWEINEGSVGHMYINLDEIKIEHEWEITEMRDTDLNLEIKPL